MISRLYSLAYTLAVWLAQPLMRRKLARRALVEPGYAESVEERFGHYSAPAEPSDVVSGEGRLWLHAVSLGETRAAAILLAQLRQQRPGLRLLLTHGTATGRAEGRKLLQPGDIQVWQPWDTPAAVGRFLDHFRPCLGVLMETEVWPNLVAACRARGIPLALANARLNDHSLARALRLAPLSRPAYAGLTAVWAQTAADAERLAQLGARVQGVFGNLKFDARPDPVQCEQGRAWRATLSRPVVLFASSREGEERDFFALARRAVAADPAQEPNGRRVPRVQWMIVPRHPQRFGEVEAMALEAGLSVSRRSQWRHGPVPADVWLGDSMGEMALYYSLADVALLGGSFAPLGGQNLIEAAACACPVVMGPHTFNFAEAAELAQAAGAAQQAPDLAGAVEAAVKLLTDADLHGLAREAASRFAQSHRGAAARTARAVLALVAVPA